MADDEKEEFEIVEPNGTIRNIFLNFKTFSLGVVFGRAVPKVLNSAESFVELCDPRASKKHFKVTLESGTLCIQDLGSRNGTILNEVALSPHESTIWTPSDIIEIGSGTKIRRRVGNEMIPDKEGGCCCLICGKNLSKLSSIQRTYHVDKCLELLQRKESPIAVPSRKKVKSTPAPGKRSVKTKAAQTGMRFAFAKKVSLVSHAGIPFISTDDDEVFEAESCALIKSHTERLVKHQRAKKEAAAAAVQQPFPEPFRAESLSQSELLRRKAYFEKQLFRINELLQSYETPNSSQTSNTLVSPMSIGGEDMLKINWEGRLELDSTLDDIKALCTRFETEDQERVKKLL